ncbi:MAG: hypothetical protein IPJ65_22410 [Archangiaceae bacterium]|nr:hypothetical protein [Archangiaceae bacterium]
MDEPTSLLPPTRSASLAELLEQGPLPLKQGLEVLAAVALQLVRLHAREKGYGMLIPQQIRVQTFSDAPPLVQLAELDTEATRDLSEGVDQYALGVLTFDVLVGRYPNPSETFAQAMPHAPPALERLVTRLMLPRAADRAPLSVAQQQLDELAHGGSDPMGVPTAGRGVPIAAAAMTDPEHPVVANPFADDERTAMVDPRPTVPSPPPSAEDERTQMEKVTRRRARPSGRREPLAPPVMTPEVTRAAEPSVVDFEPRRSDLPAKVAPEPIDPSVPVRRRRREKPETVWSQLIITAQRQPLWVWGAVGLGLGVFVLLLIALAR